MYQKSFNLCQNYCKNISVCYNRYCQQNMVAGDRQKVRYYMNTIIAVMKSLVDMNEWVVERFDIQRITLPGGAFHYKAHLYVKSFGAHIIIRQDGSFYWDDMEKNND